MQTFRYVIFALCLSATLTLIAQEGSDIDKTSLITIEQARQMGREAASEVTLVYLDKGIEAALEKADALNAALWSIPNDRLSPDIRTNYRGAQTPEAVMRGEMWKEAQMRTGNSDPLWALEIFKWLDHHGLIYEGEKTSRLRPLASNLYAEYCGLGRMGEAHLIIQEMAAELLENGLNTNTEELEDLGPWHPDFPLLRMRPYRIKRNADSRGSRKGYYVYSNFMTMGRIASQSAREGKWQQAGELCIWIRTYADAFGKAVPNAERNQGFDTRQSYSTSSLRLARILTLHGEPELAVEILDELISRNYTGYKGIARDRALIYRESLLRQLGRSTPDSIERVAEIISRFRKNPHASQGSISNQLSTYAKLLHHHGRTEEAWEVIYAQERKLSQHAASAFNTMRRAKINLALEEGLHENVEGWLIESLEYARSKGIKDSEPNLYKQYAELEAARGNMSAAISLLSEANRINKALGLKHATEENDVKLAIYRAALANPSTNSSAGFLAPCDLQPQAMTSISLTGKSAIGRFTLSNPSDTDATGTLEIVGELASVTYDATSNTVVVTTSDISSSSHKEPITLKAQEQLIVVAHAEAPSLDPEQVMLKWIHSEHPPSVAVWTYSSSESEVSKSFINASSVKDNPFYLVPIFHTLQRVSASDNEANNFRFIASSPMRVEAYASDTGQLLYIDANGDGDLMDSGDQLINDRDHDGYADIAFDTNRENVAIEVYFRSIQAIEQSPVELSLELKVGELWEVQCINQISF